MTVQFRLNKTFLKKYENKAPPFGFNGLGEVVYKRTYSRLKDDGTNEDWWETIQRVVEGTYSMQKRWVKENGLGWDRWKAQQSAKEMYDLIFNMKFLPPGRGLWAMGSTITEDRNLYASLQNCGFVSTETLKEDKSKPFCFLMDMSMLGVGVGFDTKGAMRLLIHEPIGSPSHIRIPDSREGWVSSVESLLDSYFNKSMNPIEFDYAGIRPEGAAIKGFGGKCSGYKPLESLHESIRSILDNLVGKRLTITAIVDIMNLIGVCVVSGNVRRSAEIAFGDPRDEEFLDLKNPDLYQKEMTSHRWASNNTIFSDLGMDYNGPARRTRKRGEPGYAWLKNMQDYSRMIDPPDYKDKKAKGGNPCLEQTLESYELCCLVEVFPDKCVSHEEYLKALKYAYLYAKTVTLGKSHWPETNRVMLRNRRIGCSMSGLVQFIRNRGLGTLKHWCETGYEYIRSVDQVYADWLCIPESIKCTSVKPSGSVSKLSGATSGIHWPISRYCQVRVTVAKNHMIFEDLKKAGYTMEQDLTCEGAVKVLFPVDHGEGLRAEDQVSAWEKISLAAFMQKYWADNQVSATITFHPESEGCQIEAMLDYFQYQLKGVSFLPMGGVYPQMTYEIISRKTYDKMVAQLKPLEWTGHADAVPERFCDNDVCQI